MVNVERDLPEGTDASNLSPELTNATDFESSEVVYLSANFDGNVNRKKKYFAKSIRVFYGTSLPLDRQPFGCIY
jgi:hypothetical protein